MRRLCMATMLLFIMTATAAAALADDACLEEINKFGIAASQKSLLAMTFREFSATC